MEVWKNRSAPLTTSTDHTATVWLTSGSHGDVFLAQKAASQLHRRNMPLLHMSNIQVRHCMWRVFTRHSFALVLQATNTGAKNPVYKATDSPSQANAGVAFSINCPQDLNHLYMYFKCLLQSAHHIRNPKGTVTKTVRCKLNSTRGTKTTAGAVQTSQENFQQRWQEE